jgi:HEAT repeat protein
MKTGMTQKLGALLKDGVDVHRCAAARALGIMKGPVAVAALRAALLDEDPDVRVDAANALALIQDKDTADKLMESLIGDPEADVKKAAMSALVAMRHAPVVALLRALAVSRAEDQIGWDEAAFYSDGWDAWDDIQLAAIRGLGEFEANEAVDDILTALADELGQDVSEAAFQALAHMGSTGAEALQAIYESGDIRLNRRIARAVGQAQNRHLDELRAEMLGDKAPLIRALALENLAPDDARLAKMFIDEDAGVRAAVLRHHGGNHLHFLPGMIADMAPEVRIEVFKIIAANPKDFADQNIAKAIKSTLKGDPEAARHAALALFALKGPKVAKGFTHVLGKQDIPREFRIGILETLEKAGEIGVPALLDVAGDADRQLRLAALTTLANIAVNDPVWPNDAGRGLLLALKGELVLPPEAPEPDEVEPDSEPVSEPDSELAAEPDQTELEEIAKEIDESLPLVAEDAAPGSTLRAIMANEPDKSAPEPQEIILDPVQQRLLEVTNSRGFAKRKVSWATELAPFLDVRRFSARLLGQISRDDVTQALMDAIQNDPDTELLEAILFSLCEHGRMKGHLPVALRAQIDPLLGSDVSEIRVLATRILGFLPDDDIDGVLASLVSHEDQLVRVQAIRALDRRNVADDVLYTALHDDYLGAGIVAAGALARITGDKAAAALVEFASRNDGIYRREIGRLLGQYAPQEGAARLLDLLEDQTRRIEWLVAIDALAELYQHQAPDRELLVA